MDHLNKEKDERKRKEGKMEVEEGDQRGWS